MKKRFCFESMTVFKIAHYRVRIWRTEEKLGDATRLDLLRTRRALLLDMVDTAARPFSASMVLETFVALPKVAAVEVTHVNSGNGTLVYVDWPN